MTAYAIRELKPKHRQMLIMAFSGVNQREIASYFGYTEAAVSCILRSPIARAEIARMHVAAVGEVVNLPQRVVMDQQLKEAAQEGLKVNRALLRDPYVKAETRARIGQHFMDRVIFDEPPENAAGSSYREILKRLDSLKDKKVEDLPRLPANVDTSHVVVHEKNQHETGGVAVLVEDETQEVRAKNSISGNGSSSSNDGKGEGDALDWLLNASRDEESVETKENGVRIFDLGEDDG